MQHLAKPVAAICLAVASVFAQAQEVSYDFNIPALPTIQALEALSRQSGLQPFFADNHLKGVQSPGVKGRYSAREALNKLLAGTGLIYQFTGDKSVAIKPSTVAKPIQTGEPSHPLELGEVVVTAQQRKQREIDVPIAINTLRSEEIASRGISNLQNLSFAVPGMTTVVTGMAQNRVMLRGIGEGAGGGNFPLVGIRQDEVAVDGPLRGGLDVRPLDVERVEVLNGPQGTLYGQGSMGGTVRFVTHNPVIGKTSMNAALDLSSTKSGAPSQRFTGVANVSLNDSAALRIAGSFENTGGWIDAPTAGQKNINDGEMSQIRVKGLFHVTERLSLTPMVQVLRNKVGSLTNGENADGNLMLPAFAPNAVQSARNDHELYSLTADWEVVDGIKLLAIGSMFRNDSTGGYYSTTPNGQIGIVSQFDNHDEARSGELRLMSDHAGPWQWTVGSLYRDVEYRQATTGQMGLVNSPTPMPGSTSSVISVKSKSWSFYGNTSYDLTERLQVGGGLRYFMDEQTSPNAGQASQNFDSIDPRLFASYKLMRNWNVYTSAAKGFRSGGFNTASVLFPSTFKPESVWSYEVGTKFGGFGDLFSGQLAGFVSHYTDMQTSTLAVAPSTFYTDNVGRARIQGIDWSFKIQPTDWIAFGASGTLQDTEVTSVKPNSAYIVGDRLNYIPKYNYGVFVETQASLANNVQARFRVDYNVRGSSVLAQRSYNTVATNDRLDLLNMRLAFTRKEYGIEFYGENLLNDRGQTFPNPVNFATRMVPLTVGIRGTVSF